MALIRCGGGFESFLPSSYLMQSADESGQRVSGTISAYTVGTSFTSANAAHENTAIVNVKGHSHLSVTSSGNAYAVVTGVKNNVATDLSTGTAAVSQHYDGAIDYDYVVISTYGGTRHTITINVSDT